MRRGAAKEGWRKKEREREKKKERGHRLIYAGHDQAQLSSIAVDLTHLYGQKRRSSKNNKDRSVSERRKTRDSKNFLLSINFFKFITLI